MKKIIWITMMAALLSLTFTSCEKEEVNEPVSISERTPLEEDLGKRTSIEVTLGKSSSTLDLSSELPSSISELRREQIEVSQGLANFVGSLRRLLRAAELSETNPNRLRRLGFFQSEIVELRTINAEYAVLENFLLNFDANTFTSVPSTIEEARAAGIRITTQVARLGDLETLLTRSLVRTGFLDTLNSRDIFELRRLRRVFEAIQEVVGAGGGDTDPDPDPNPDPDQDPGSDPSLTAAQQAFVNRFGIPQDVLDELIARNSVDRLISREQRQLSNPRDLVVLGPDLFEVTIGINQGTDTTRVTRTRAQLEGNFSFGYLFDSQTPNTAETFDRMGREVFQALLDSL